jgi:hypothetical protein
METCTLEEYMRILESLVTHEENQHKNDQIHNGRERLSPQKII